MSCVCYLGIRLNSLLCLLQTNIEITKEEDFAWVIFLILLCLVHIGQKKTNLPFFSGGVCGNNMKSIPSTVGIGGILSALSIKENTPPPTQKKTSDLWLHQTINQPQTDFAYKSMKENGAVTLENIIQIFISHFILISCQMLPTKLLYKSLSSRNKKLMRWCPADQAFLNCECLLQDPSVEE